MSSHYNKKTQDQENLISTLEVLQRKTDSAITSRADTVRKPKGKPLLAPKKDDSLRRLYDTNDINYDQGNREDDEWSEFY